MALRRLTTGEMVQVSLPWVTEGTEARKAILATAEIAGLLPRVEAAHQALHAAQPTAEDPRLARLQEKAAAVDLRHDELVRGVYWLLSGLGWITGEGSSADSLVRLRDLLFPAGLETTQKSYRDEAGALDLLKTRLAADPASKKQLKDIPVLKRTLAYYIDELTHLGAELGDLENERAQLVQPSGPSDAARTVNARNQWIRAVNALVANAELAEVDADTSRLVFGPLRLAEKAADRRKGPAAEASEPAAPPGEAPPTK
ncbi:MAG: hypothetical protein R3B70_46745 [Polyangiaceae bacterium]